MIKLCAHCASWYMQSPCTMMELANFARVFMCSLAWIRPRSESLGEVTSSHLSQVIVIFSADADAVIFKTPRYFWVLVRAYLHFLPFLTHWLEEELEKEVEKEN